MSASPFNDQLWAQVCQAFDDGWDYGVQEKLNHKGKRAEGLRRAIAALEAAGYAVVPKEPTEAMCQAFDNVPWRTLAVGLANYTDECRAAWSAMITAAKETP